MRAVVPTSEDSSIDWDYSPQYHSIYVYTTNSGQTIQETKAETDAFDFIRCFVHQYNRQNTNNTKLVVYIVGGFITAKLCNIPTNCDNKMDVDLAISGMTGEEFCKLFAHFMLNKHNIDIKYQIIQDNERKAKFENWHLSF